MSLGSDPYSFLGKDIKANLDVRVWSIGSGQVVYQLTDPPVNRVWRPGELKIIPFHELYQLKNTPGGYNLLFHRLQIRDNKVREALELPLDPEYLYTEEDAKNLVLNGSNEQILDALEFGPTGLASMIKHNAVLYVNSIEKMNFFNRVFSMNIQEIREINKEEVSETTDAPKRRVESAPKQEESFFGKRRKADPLTPSEPTVQTPTEE
jgi:hypothetical protein